MIANVTEQLWIDFGLDIAVFLDTLAYWVKKNAANQKHFYDGRYWSYNSYPAFTKMFPGWKIETIRRIIRNCVKHELIIIGNYNKKSYDNTNWYALTDKAMQYYPAMTGLLLDTPVDSNRPPVDSNRPIPKLQSTSNINITTSDVEESVTVKTQDVVDAYHETLPDSPKIKVCGNELTKQVKSMIKNWPKYQKDGKSFSIHSFKDYLLYIKRHYSWFLQPYPTESGKIKRNNLTNITREKNIVRIVNGEFSAN